MGLFLSMSGVIGKTKEDVEKCLKEFAKKNGGDLLKENLDNENPNFCVINENKGNVTILYPSGFEKSEDVSKYLSEKLDCPVFFFHIHDGDLWLYFFYSSGELVDQFNPIPDYWDDNLSETEIDEQKGNPQLVAELVPNIKKENIANYYVRWDLEAEPIKAYPQDEFTNEDWQVLDFMDKIGLKYPISDSGTAVGTIYKFWTTEPTENDNKRSISKKWWEFWN
ncbi:hypothetical protein [Galbibacter mesophilus]|uniref:hypothetical protein n=1 Tax=Galbibacter mesophilus TaxID=379069 RepID=UPI00191C9DF0|nr:hypothetical protein [Galbibacter mesophilus]MCM5661950.1 hypothetical protein [Galbibacter mesophilus]